jgi:hypothetical protein
LGVKDRRRKTDDEEGKIDEGEKMAGKKIPQNLDCKSESHGKHLCYIISQGFHLSDVEEYDTIVKDPKFKCRHCGRRANSANNLCEPIGL